MHGNYCGPDYASGRAKRTAFGHNLGRDVPPVDSLDDACRIHDKHYELESGGWSRRTKLRHAADRQFLRNTADELSLKSHFARGAIATKATVDRLVGIEPNPGPAGDAKTLVNRLVKQANQMGLTREAAMTFVNVEYRNITGEAPPPVIMGAIGDGIVPNSVADAAPPQDFVFPNTNWRILSMFHAGPTSDTVANGSDIPFTKWSTSVKPSYTRGFTATTSTLFLADPGLWHITGLLLVESTASGTVKAFLKTSALVTHQLLGGYTPLAAEQVPIVIDVYAFLVPTDGIVITNNSGVSIKILAESRLTFERLAATWQ